MRPFSLHHFSSSFHFGGRNQRSNAAVLPASCVPFSWPHFPIVLNSDTEHHQSATARGLCTPESDAVGGASNEREIDLNLGAFLFRQVSGALKSSMVCRTERPSAFFPDSANNQLVVVPSTCFWITDDSLCCTNGTLAR